LREFPTSLLVAGPSIRTCSTPPVVCACLKSTTGNRLIPSYPMRPSWCSVHLRARAPGTRLPSLPWKRVAVSLRSYARCSAVIVIALQLPAAPSGRTVRRPDHPILPSLSAREAQAVVFQRQAYRRVREGPDSRHGRRALHAHPARNRDLRHSGLLDNRLLDESQRSFQASMECANTTTSGHRACLSGMFDHATFSRFFSRLLVYQSDQLPFLGL
jgi:hypothetical protein